MSKENNLKDFLADLYEGIASVNPNASKNPQDFRTEIEAMIVPKYDGSVSTRYLPPGISISGSILTITDYSRCADTINIYADTLDGLASRLGDGSLNYTFDLSLTGLESTKDYTIFASLTHSGVETSFSIAVLYKAGG